MLVRVVGDLVAGAVKSRDGRSVLGAFEIFTDCKESRRDRLSV
jgi:hypothetical protein